MAVRAKVDMLIDPVLNGRLCRWRCCRAAALRVGRGRVRCGGRPPELRGSGRAGDGHDRGLGPAAIGQEHRGRLQRSAHRIPGGEPGRSRSRSRPSRTFSTGTNSWSLSGGTGPDVMSLDEIWTPEFAAAGVIEPPRWIDRGVLGGQAEIFFSGAWDTNIWQDQVWGVPLNFDVWEQLYYNADMFTAAGLDPDNPPKTWDEWLAAAEQLTSPPQQFGIGLIGIKGEAGGRAPPPLDVLERRDGHRRGRPGGTRFAGESRNLTFFERSPGSLRGIANVGEPEAVSAFTAGQVAMLLTGRGSRTR